ncbi:MAG TPA: hypothetical protein VF052_06450 [Solirubrobacterales bacterium]
MAQTTSSSSTRSKRSGSRANRSTSRNGRSRPNASSRTKRTGSNGGSARTSRRTTTSTGKARSSSTNGPIAAAGEKVSNVASKAKAPLIAVGAAVAGVAGGVALKSRNQQRKPLSKLHAPSLPKSVKKIDLSKIDLDAITSAANRVRSIGEQVGDVADAAEKTRKKHK